MPVVLTPLVEVRELRWGPRCFVYGDPYELITNVHDEGDGEALLSGFVGEPPFAARREIREALKAAGFRYARIERRGADGSVKSSRRWEL